MNPFDLIIAQFDESVSLRQKLVNNNNFIEQIISLSSRIIQSLKIGGKIIFAGNGGSFADAQHLAAEFTGRFLIDREPFNSVCLATNSSYITAVGNDYHFDDIFERELKAIAKPNDIFIALSTSGNSKNLIKAVNFAKSENIYTFAFLGRDGGQIANLAPSIIIPSNSTARIQELHITVGHILCLLIDEESSINSPLEKNK